MIWGYPHFEKPPHDTFGMGKLLISYENQIRENRTDVLMMSLLFLIVAIVKQPIGSPMFGDEVFV